MTNPNSPPKVLIGTPVWDVVDSVFLTDWTELICSVFRNLEHWNATVKVRVKPGCLLPFSRNYIVQDAYKEMPDFTHVVMIDSDIIGLRGDMLKRMVSWDVPIVAAPVVRPAGEFDLCVEHEDKFHALHAEMRKDEPGLVERKWVGTGCICIRRDVLDATAIPTEVPDGKIGLNWFRVGREERKGWDREMQDTVKNRTEGLLRSMLDRYRESEDLKGWTDGMAQDLADALLSTYLQGRGVWDESRIIGEDIEFCTRARVLGFKSYVDCGIEHLKHMLPTGYGIDEHLKRSCPEILMRQNEDEQPDAPGAGGTPEGVPETCHA